MPPFQQATNLAVQAWLTDPHWEDQEEDPSGAPVGDTYGETLENKAVTIFDLRLRESLRYRKGRVTIPDNAQDNTTYEIDVRGLRASYTSSGSADKPEILNGLARGVNGLKLDVRAYTTDTDNDNNADTLILKSNHTSLSVSATSNGTTHSVTIEGVTVEYQAGSGDSVGDVMDELIDLINGSSDMPFAKAFKQDTDDDGVTEMFFVLPVDYGSLTVSATNATVHMLGRESDNPSVDVSDSTPALGLDLDAASLDTVRFYGLMTKGESTVPGGWRLVEEYTNVDYRGFQKTLKVGPFKRGYIEVVHGGSGTLRSTKIGYSTAD